MACVQFQNFLFTEIAEAINTTATTFEVQSTANMLFQGAELQAGDWFYLTLTDRNSFQNRLEPPSTWEIVKVTADRPVQILELTAPK